MGQQLRVLPWTEWGLVELTRRIFVQDDFSLGVHPHLQRRLELSCRRVHALPEEVLLSHSCQHRCLCVVQWARPLRHLHMLVGMVSLRVSFCQRFRYCLCLEHWLVVIAHVLPPRSSSVCSRYCIFAFGSFFLRLHARSVCLPDSAISQRVSIQFSAGAPQSTLSLRSLSLE